MISLDVREWCHSLANHELGPVRVSLCIPVIYGANSYMSEVGVGIWEVYQCHVEHPNLSFVYVTKDKSLCYPFNRLLTLSVFGKLAFHYPLCLSFRLHKAWDLPKATANWIYFLTERNLLICRDQITELLYSNNSTEDWIATHSHHPNEQQQVNSREILFPSSLSLIYQQGVDRKGTTAR